MKRDALGSSCTEARPSGERHKTIKEWFASALPLVPLKIELRYTRYELFRLRNFNVHLGGRPYGCKKHRIKQNRSRKGCHLLLDVRKTLQDASGGVDWLGHACAVRY